MNITEHILAFTLLGSEWVLWLLVLLSILSVAVMVERGIALKDVEATCYGNALAAYAQSGQMLESHWLAPDSVDQRTMFEGNSVLRGQDPRVGAPQVRAEPADAMAFK